MSPDYQHNSRDFIIKMARKYDDYRQSSFLATLFASTWVGTASNTAWLSFQLLMSPSFKSFA